MRSKNILQIVVRITFKHKRNERNAINKLYNTKMATLFENHTLSLSMKLRKQK